MRKKKKKKHSKPRSTSIRWRTNGIVSNISVFIDPFSETISANSVEPDSVFSVVSYERQSGKEKVLISAPATQDAPAFDIDLQISLRSSKLIAIDTNTKYICGRKVSVTCAYFADLNLRTATGAIPIEPLCAYAILEASPEVNVERIGWNLVLKSHVNLNSISASNQVGIVIDSDLSDLQDLNSRKKPYYEDNALPDGCFLLFASSDASTEHIPSEMISLCDRNASMILNHIDSTQFQFGSGNQDDKNCAGYFFLELKMPPPQT